MRGAAMGSTAATSGFLVLFLFVSVVQSRDVLTYISAHICAMRGSTVDIRVKRQSISVEKILWFTDMQDEEPVDLRTDSEYAGRVKYFCDMTTCTLRITDLKESDSAEYNFRLKDRHMRNFTRLPGVTLSVTDPDLQVKVTKLYSSWAELFCHSACHLPDRPSYVWYKNGQKIQTETPSYSDYADPADSFSCAVRGQEDFPSPSVCVDGHTCNRVMYTDRSICAAEGSSVDVSSTYNSYEDEVESKFWFSPERRNQWKNPSQPEDLSEDWQYAGRVQVFETARGRSTLRISDLRQSDAAQYHFKFKTPRFEWRSDLPGTTLTVTGLQVQVIRKTVRPSHTEAQLLCQNSCSPPGHFSFVWFKNGQRIMAEETSTYTDSFYPRDNISCALKGHEDARSLSLNAPKVPSVSVSPPGEITEGSSVTLTCDANTAANYTWYEKNLKLLSKKQQLVFSSIQISDSGEYYCTAEDELGATTSESIFIDVKYAPVVLSVSVSPSAEIEEGSSVTLTCSSDANPAANYTWYKENEDSPKAFRQIFIITEIRAEHSGNYYCEAQNSRGRQNSTLHLIIVSSSMKSVAAGSITVIFLALIFLSAFLLMRRKKSLEQTLEPRVRQDNKLQVNMVTVRDVPSAPRPRSQAEQQDDLCYASVTFLKNREDPLYSNIRLGQPIRPKEVEEEDDEEDEEEDVEYTAVMYKSNGAATGSTHQEAAEDSSELYSTVCKNTRV